MTALEFGLAIIGSATVGWFLATAIDWAWSLLAPRAAGKAKR